MAQDSASPPPVDPDPRTAADDDPAFEGDATAAPGEGVSATDPAEGADDAPGEQPGSARG